MAAWKLWCLLPRMVLFQTKRVGEAGTRNLLQRIPLFDDGRWDVLLGMSESSVPTKTQTLHDSDHSLKRAVNFVKNR